jgi:hypothetical protein
MPPRQAVPRIVTSAGLALLDVPNDRAEGEVLAKRWQRGARGIYLTHPDPPTDRELCQVARAHVGEDFIVTGLVVLRALELPWLPNDPRIHVLVPPDSRRSSSTLIRVTRTSSYDRLTTWVQYGCRFADPARATLDAARGVSALREARGVVLGAVAQGCSSVVDLTTLLEAGQRNGSGMVRRAISDAARGCASPPEAELVDGMVGRGVPFYVNPELWHHGVLLGSTDVWLAGTGSGGEVESQERHGDAIGVENTYDRHERFAAAGVNLVHLSVARIRRDVGEATDYLLRRARSGPPAPPELLVLPKGPLLR